MQSGGGAEEEVLAISPPPEFQDIPAPPPVVFRDLSPAPGGKNSPGGQAGKYGQERLFDFADRISFDILNEAMVIATEEVLSAFQPHNHGGCNRSAEITAPFISGEFSISSVSSDSDESNPLITTTSWEYLSKGTPWSQVNSARLPSSHKQPSPCPSPHNLRSSALRSFISSSSSNEVRSTSFNSTNPVSFHNEEIPISSQRSSINRSCSFQTNSRQPNLYLLDDNTRSSASASSKSNRSSYFGGLLHDQPSKPFFERSLAPPTANEMCSDNVPFQCDIYSMPIDSIHPNSGESMVPTLAPRRRSRERNSNSRCPERSRSSRQALISVNLSSRVASTNANANNGDEVTMPQSQSQCEAAAISGKSSTNRNNVSKKLVKPAISLDSSRNAKAKMIRSSEGIASRIEKNNNLEQRNECSSDYGREKGTAKPQRSRSVEMNPGSSDQKHCSSQSQDIFKDSTSGESGCLGKNEKRTLVLSIRNLFKRNKARTKEDLLDLDEPLLKSQEPHSICSPSYRALPSPPICSDIPDPFPEGHILEARDFAASIEKVKDCGWYWGPLSSESAEDLLRGEPDGSFIVRDSSDAHYIFSLTFKLNGLVRHVRIEHDQGNFSFGPLTRFKASTIVDFVEKAVAHSRSGRYLFFLHRRPILGPMRVQLLHPYSRFRHPRSLQHMCRFVILKYVRKDLIHTLPLPKPLQEYLNTPHYYFEKQGVKTSVL